MARKGKTVDGVRVDSNKKLTRIELFEKLFNCGSVLNVDWWKQEVTQEELDNMNIVILLSCSPFKEE